MTTNFSDKLAIRRRLEKSIRGRTRIILGALPHRAANVESAIQDMCMAVTGGQHYRLDDLSIDQLSKIVDVLTLDREGLSVFADWPAERRKLVKDALGREGTIWELDTQAINVLLVHVTAYNKGYWQGVLDTKEQGDYDG